AVDKRPRFPEGESVGDPQFRQPIRRDQQHDHDGEALAQTRSFHLTGFVTFPDPGISTSTRSPAASGPTPAGVPVAITSPGSSVITRVMYSMSTGMENAISSARPRWRTSPFTRQTISSVAGSI